MDGAPRYFLFLLPLSCLVEMCRHDSLLTAVVEHYRILWNFVHVVYAKEDNGKSICNAAVCPRMSAGP